MKSPSHDRFGSGRSRVGTDTAGSRPVPSTARSAESRYVAYLLAAEEVYESIPGIGGTEQPGVRADIVLCPLKGGGAFFSVGSIAYTGSLSHNKYDNNIARMTGNVLRRFLQPEPLDVVLREAAIA